MLFCTKCHDIIRPAAKSIEYHLTRCAKGSFSEVNRMAREASSALGLPTVGDQAPM